MRRVLPLVLIVALTFWGFFKGLYDANIFASVYDVVPAEARGTAAGLMNAIGWLAGEESSYVNGQTLVIDGGLEISRALARDLLGD